MPVRFIRLARFKYTSNSWSLFVVTTKDFGCTASRLNEILEYCPAHASFTFRRTDHGNRRRPEEIFKS